jgi:hypothetical protein
MTRPVLFLTGNLTNVTTTNYETGTCCTRFTLECTSGCLTGDSIPCEAWGNKAAEVAQLSSALFTGELSLGRKLLISEWAAA